MENFRALFYAPYYAAHALGIFKQEGVDVELVTSGTPGDAVPLLIDGTIDLTWGGPMRVMTAHDRDDQSPLVCFGEVVSRDPFFLIGNSIKKFTSALAVKKDSVSVVIKLTTLCPLLSHCLFYYHPAINLIKPREIVISVLLRGLVT